MTTDPAAPSLRVLQLVTRPQRRGAEIFALELCGELERRGHRTLVVALHPAPPGGVLPLRDGDLALDADADSPLETLPGFQPALLRRLLATVDDFAPDVVQVNGSRTVKYGSLLRRRRRRAPWALVYRSIGNPEDWLPNPLRRELYRRLVVAPMDAIVAVSRATRESLERCYRPQVPVTVLPRAVAVPERLPTDPERQRLRRELGAGSATPVLLFVGRLSPEKRPDRLLRVAAGIARLRQGQGAPPELWIVGDGPLRSTVEEQLPSLPLPVRLFGEQDDVGRFMAAADLLLLTSDTEGLPGVVLEAGAVGLPAVATRVGGVEECIRDGETGRVVAADAEGDLARAAAALLADEDHRRTLGRAAAELVRSRFSLPSVAEGYVDLYRRAVARRREGG